MNDLNTAIKLLQGHTICLCKNGKCLFDDAKGIRPMMNLIEDGVDLSGYSVADLVVGKAVAMLFVKVGIKAVFGKVMSKSAMAFLEKNGVSASAEELTEQIINRDKTDVCPMEKAVKDIDDVEIGFSKLMETLKALSKGKTIQNENK